MSAAHQVLDCEGRSVQVGALLPDPIPGEGHLRWCRDHERSPGAAMKKKEIASQSRALSGLPGGGRQP